MRIRETLKMQNFIEDDDGTIYDSTTKKVIWSCSCNSGQQICSSSDQKQEINEP